MAAASSVADERKALVDEAKNTLLKDIPSRIKDARKLQSLVDGLKAGKVVRLTNGQEFGKREVGQVWSIIAAEIKAATKQLERALKMKKSRSTRKTTVRTHFSIPARFNDDVRGFVLEALEANALPNVSQADVVALGEVGYSINTLLNRLFSRYANSQNLFIMKPNKKTGEMVLNRSYIAFDERLTRYFGKYLEQINAKRASEGKAAYSADNIQYLPFLQSLWSTTKDKDDILLTKEQLAAYDAAIATQREAQKQADGIVTRKPGYKGVPPPSFPLINYAAAAVAAQAAGADPARVKFEVNIDEALQQLRAQDYPADYAKWAARQAR